MRKLLSVGLLALVVVHGVSESALAGPSKSTHESAPQRAIKAVIDEAVHDRVFAGAAVGVAEDGHIKFVRGYGRADLELNVPVTEKTIFRIGSMTKQFTAAALLKLVDQGKLSVDDPLSNFLPDFPRAKDVTLRQLLTHTSGIATYTNPKSAEEGRDLGRKEWTSETLIAHIARFNPVYEFEPGTGWSYSNSGYILLGAVIEKVSGKSYAEFLKTEIFDPLELRDTSVDDFAPIVPNRARGYAASKTAPSGFSNPDFMSLSAAGPAGAIRSTAADMLNWHIELFGGRVLKPETFALMITPARLKDGRLASQGKVPPLWTSPTSEYGFGFFLDSVEGHKSVGHGGAIPGFNSWMETFPDDRVTIVLLTNTDYPAAEHTGPKVTKAFFSARKN